jgi:hypothetical protein
MLQEVPAFTAPLAEAKPAQHQVVPLRKHDNDNAAQPSNEKWDKMREVSPINQEMAD